MVRDLDHLEQNAVNAEGIVRFGTRPSVWNVSLPTASVELSVRSPEKAVES